MEIISRLQIVRRRKERNSASIAPQLIDDNAKLVSNKHLPSEAISISLPIT